MLVQIQFLNKLLDEKDLSIVDDNVLDEEYFPDFKKEFNFIKDHYVKYSKIPDKETFVSNFPKFDILDVSEKNDYLIGELRREKTERLLVSTLNEAKNLIVNKKTEQAADLISSIKTDLNASKHLEAVDILTDISRYDSYVDKCNDFSKFYVTTGFRELDLSLGGGLDRQNAYTVISARAGIGKTLIMINMAKAAAEKGLTVGFYEGEMEVTKIANRYDTLASHIANSSINHGRSDVSVVYKKFLDELKVKHKGHLYVLTRDMIGSDRVTVSTLRAFVEKYNLDMLFVDQISLMDDENHGKQLFEQASNISKGLKTLQVQKHIPIVVASQQNRGAVDEAGLAGTQNLSLSDRIGQDATEVIFITKKDDLLTMNIAKARDGCRQNTLNYEVNFNTCEFSYRAQEDDKITSLPEYKGSMFTPEASPEFESDELPFM